MKNIKYIFKNYFVLILSLGFVIVFATTIHVFATDWPYAPGTTLNPGCLPGVGGCTVTIPTADWTTASNNMFNTNTGNIGIGTTIPSGLFNVEGVNGTQLILDDTASNVSLQYSNDAGDWAKDVLYVGADYVELSSYQGAVYSSSGFYTELDSVGSTILKTGTTPNDFFSIISMPDGIPPGSGLIGIPSLGAAFYVRPTISQSIISSSSAVSGKLGVVINSSGSTINQDVQNSVIIGGSGITATDDNTVYVQNLNVTGTCTGCGGGSSSYDVYSALLSEDATMYICSISPDPYPTSGCAPQVKVLNSGDSNYLGDIVWSYNGVGNYLGTLPGAFTEDKTFIAKIGDGQGAYELSSYYILTRLSDSTLELDVEANNTLSKHSIEIRVYP